MDAETTGIVISSGAVGALCTLGAAWIKAKFGQRAKVEADPSPFPVQQQGPFVTVGECKQHRCALEKRIDALGPALNRIFKKLSENDHRSEDRSLHLHRRIDPVVEKLAATAATFEMMKGQKK